MSTITLSAHHFMPLQVVSSSALSLPSGGARRTTQRGVRGGGGRPLQKQTPPTHLMICGELLRWVAEYLKYPAGRGQTYIHSGVI